MIHFLFPCKNVMKNYIEGRGRERQYVKNKEP